jgi:uncharacterized protein involved in exopolysaccharide biosynthesis
MNNIDSNDIIEPEKTIAHAAELFLSYMTRLARLKNTLILIILVPTLLAALISLIIPKKFDASATILPVDEASRFGSLSQELSQYSPIPLGLPSGLSDFSTSMYPDILKSRLISKAILHTEFTFPSPEDGSREITTTLFDLWEVENDDVGLKVIFKAVTIFIDKQTGIVRISARTRSPVLSANIVNEYLNQLDHYNTQVRTSRAKEALIFTENRLEEIKKELLMAEQELNAFQKNNRNYFNTTDPNLLLQHGRLNRQREMKNQLFLTLTNQYEVIRIEAKKDIPVIQVLDAATPPMIKATPRRKFIVIAVFSIMFLLCLFVLMLVELYSILPGDLQRRLRRIFLSLLPKFISSRMGPDYP